MLPTATLKSIFKNKSVFELQENTGHVALLKGPGSRCSVPPYPSPCHSPKNPVQIASSPQVCKQNLVRTPGSSSSDGTQIERSQCPTAHQISPFKSSSSWFLTSRAGKAAHTPLQAETSGWRDHTMPPLSSHLKIPIAPTKHRVWLLAPSSSQNTCLAPPVPAVGHPSDALTQPKGT